MIRALSGVFLCGNSEYGKPFKSRLQRKKMPKIDLYPDIFDFKGIDGKTYGAPFQRRLQGGKTAIFDTYHDIFSALSVRLDS